MTITINATGAERKRLVRYIEQAGTDEKVSVLRDGKVLPFIEVANTAPEV
jgi:hypothetical protein